MYNSCSNSKIISNISYEIVLKKSFISPFLRKFCCVPHFASRQLRSLTKRLALCSALVVPALAAPLLVGVGPAHATCDPSPLTNGATIVCSADVIVNATNALGLGLNDGSHDDIDLTILEGVTLTGISRAVFLNDRIVITNFGTLSNNVVSNGGSTPAVHVRGTLVDLTNAGTISGNRPGETGITYGVLAGSIDSVTNTGSITVQTTGSAGPAVALQGSNGVANVTNSGTISATTNSGQTTGVQSSSGSITNVTNSGVISALAGQGISRGFFAETDIENITNSGTISAESTVSSDSTGVGVGSITGSISNFTNFGTVSAATASGTARGLAASGIIDFTNAGVISATATVGASTGVQGVSTLNFTNTGTIRALSGGDFRTASGVLIPGNLTNFTNSGTISAEVTGTSSAAVGINAGTITGLVNTGTITGTAPGVLTEGFGVFLQSTLASLTNSGTISGSFYAIMEDGAGDSLLTLNAGSILIGRVDLGGGVNTLNIGEGLSLNSTFEDPDGASVVPILGTTSGHLVAFLDQANGGGGTDRQIVAVDPSAFASADEALAALTAGIGQTVQGRQAALRSDPALGFSAGDLTDMSALSPNRFWIEGFGAYRQDNGDRVGSTFDSLTGGLVAGVDVSVDALTSVGVMAGFAASTSENEIDTQITDTTSYYAGVYASTQALGMAWDASLTVGYSDYDQERITANNLVANGLETARADFGGWFINPQVTATREAANPLAGAGFGSLVATQTLEQSLTFSYAGLFLDGYTETGTTNPLTLDDRSIHIASARAALALPFEANHTDGALTTIRMIGGLEVRTQFGDDAISGTLLGQSVSTTLDDDDVALGGFLGLAGEYQTPSGLTAYANAEGLVQADASWQLSANAGLRIAF